MIFMKYFMRENALIILTYGGNCNSQMENENKCFIKVQIDNWRWWRKSDVAPIKPLHYDKWN